MASRSRPLHRVSNSLRYAPHNKSLDASGTSGSLIDNLSVTWLTAAASTQPFARIALSKTINGTRGLFPGHAARRMWTFAPWSRRMGFTPAALPVPCHRSYLRCAFQWWALEQIVGPERRLRVLHYHWSGAA